MMNRKEKEFESFSEACIFEIKLSGEVPQDTSRRLLPRLQIHSLRRTLNSAAAGILIRPHSRRFRSFHVNSAQTPLRERRWIAAGPWRRFVSPKALLPPPGIDQTETLNRGTDIEAMCSCPLFRQTVNSDISHPARILVTLRRCFC